MVSEEEGIKKIMGKNKTTQTEMFFVIAIYAVIFYAAWALVELVVHPALVKIINSEVTTDIIKEILIKNVLWTLTAILLIKKYKANVRISLEEMFTTKVNWLKFLPVFILFAVYVVGQKYLFTGSIAINEGVNLAEIIMYLFVGLTEEMVFRGWLLNAMSFNRKAVVPVMINAVMFLLIHFPIWIQSGILVSVFTSFGFISILVLSVIFSMSFLRSRSILVPILLHAFWDILLYVVG